MRLYLDQMLRAELGLLLREAGHDVVRASETGQTRADDMLILERAVQDGRTLVTLDGISAIGLSCRFQNISVSFG